MARDQFLPFSPERAVAVESIYTVHYFEYTSSYSFAGEAHDFWEFVYVDKGSIRVRDGEETFDLSRGQLIFHPPGRFHALSANGITAPNLVVVSFRCESPAMDFFPGRILSSGEEERSLLGRIVQESRVIFSTPLNDPTTRAMIPRKEIPFGSQQLLLGAIEELLIRLIRRGNTVPTARQELPRHTRDRVELIAEYLERRLDQSLSVEQICRDNLIGRAQLEQYFHEQTGGGVIDYFNKLKIDAARQHIREGKMNVSQIAASLGFRSVQYFSRRFKLVTGMSPSEYSRSIKMLSELPPTSSDDSANNL